MSVRECPQRTSGRDASWKRQVSVVFPAEHNGALQVKCCDALEQSEIAPVTAGLAPSPRGGTLAPDRVPSHRAPRRAPSRGPQAPLAKQEHLACRKCAGNHASRFLACFLGESRARREGLPITRLARGDEDGLPDNSWGSRRGDGDNRDADAPGSSPPEASDREGPRGEECPR
ncbi:hypothetical protein AAFF_G00434880 [Aldrovandia affinis]|uniref:Uncharacterized protein n=1 Tax=Aldrovandia affinis TaxID=143900 RepID=A0AAD7WIZ6_9TELE|nr:hypothetical protein AAFF_G00434880 [Aldrovandia affinis]